MSIRKIVFAPEEYYHIYNRGNSKRKIFEDETDYDRFSKLLYLSNSEHQFVFRDIKDVYSIDRGEKLVSIGSYTPMPNHFHILLKEKVENGITKFMHKLGTSYSRYYNLKYKRSGRLFEDKFKSEHITEDRYLKYIFSYIHLNPIKLIEPRWKEKGIPDKKAFNFLHSYKYSSYSDFLGEQRKENMILDIEDFPEYFPTKKSFEKEILDWITYQDIDQ